MSNHDADCGLDRPAAGSGTEKQEITMRSSTKWIVVLTCLALAGCTPSRGFSTGGAGRSAPPQADAVRGMDPAELQAAGLQSYWQGTVELPPGERIIRIRRLDEKLYCLTNLNTLVAVSAQVGVTKWRHNIARPGQTVFDPIHVDDVSIPDDMVGIAGIVDSDTIPTTVPFDAVIVNTLSSVVVLDRSDGREVRGPHDIHFDFAANTGGASDGASFFVGGINGRFYGVELMTGVELWQESTARLLTASVQYFAAHVYVGGEDHVFRVIKISGRRQFAWSQTLEGPITADFYVGNNQCFVPCEDRRLYAFIALNGEQLWPAFITSGELRTPVQVAEETIFQYAHADSLYAINRITGQERWNMPEGRTVLAVMEGRAYVLDENKVMHVVDEMTGEVIATVDMSSLDLLLANATTPAIYAATTDGQVFCFRPMSAGHLTPQMLEDELPQ